jgi:hypothetical protein
MYTRTRTDAPRSGRGSETDSTSRPGVRMSRSAVSRHSSSVPQRRIFTGALPSGIPPSGCRCRRAPRARPRPASPPEFLRVGGHQVGERDQFPRQELAAVVVPDSKVNAEHFEGVSAPVPVSVLAQVEPAGHAETGRCPGECLADMRRREVPVAAADDRPPLPVRPCRRRHLCVWPDGGHAGLGVAAAAGAVPVLPPRRLHPQDVRLCGPAHCPASRPWPGPAARPHDWPGSSQCMPWPSRSACAHSRRPAWRSSLASRKHIGNSS